ncbi:MAG: sulfite exporter TauE/SafE family protein [Myxococcales bacterium]|nr:sulfite exporter TauE/SafE family protein [Myxococcales bacterium]
MSLLDVLLLVGGALAGFVNTIAGAGSALTLPLLMLTGMDAAVANGTNRVGVLFQSAAATTTFHRRGVRPWRPAARALASTMVGAVGGAALATRIAPPALERLFGLVFLLLGVVMVAKPRWLTPAEPDDADRTPGLGGHAALFAVGLYGGLFQAGVGIPMLLVLCRALSLDVVRANAVKVALVCVYTVVVVAVFAGAGQVELRAGALLAVGGLVGSTLGARATIAKGAPLVRWMVTAALVAAGVKALI